MSTTFPENTDNNFNQTHSSDNVQLKHQPQFGSSLSDYEIIGQLGRGATAFVYQVKCRNLPNKKLYALKVIDKENLREKSLTQRIKQEVQVHRQLHHPSIIRLEHFFEDEQNVYLLMEYFEGLELYQFVKSLPQNQQTKLIMSTEQASHLTRQIAQALGYMQTLKIMHRDLKLSNILISPDYQQIKIIDFGLAVQLQTLEEERQTLCGTPNYIAPEIITSKPYGLQADLWSLGCITYALFTGTPPFECPSVEQTLMRIKGGKFESLNGVSEDAREFISQLLSQNRQRIGIEDVIKHQFLAEKVKKVERKVEKIEKVETDLLTEILGCDPQDKQNFNVYQQQQQQQDLDTPALKSTEQIESQTPKFTISKLNLENLNKVPQFEKKELKKVEKPDLTDFQNTDRLKRQLDFSSTNNTQNTKTANFGKALIQQDIKPFDTSLLSPFRHEITKVKGSFLHLTQKGQLHLYLSDKKKHLWFSKDLITLESSQNSPSESTYHISKLPSKLVKWHEYASKIIEAMRSKTPKYVLTLPTGQCIQFLSNDLEVRLQNKKDGPDIIKLTKFKKIDFTNGITGQIYEVDIENDVQYLPEREKKQVMIALEAFEKMKKAVELKSKDENVVIESYLDLPIQLQ